MEGIRRDRWLILLFLSVLAFPLFFRASKVTTLVPLTSALKTHDELYYRTHVFSPFLPARLPVMANETTIDIPHIIFPLYDPISGRALLHGVGLTGLQHALSDHNCYQGSTYQSPYQRTGLALEINHLQPQPCYSIDVSDVNKQNHHWQYNVSSMVRLTSAKGHIRHLSQEVPTHYPTAPSILHTDHLSGKFIAGITDKLEVFMFDNNFTESWVNRELIDLFRVELTKHNVTQIVAYKTRVAGAYVIVGVVGNDPDGNGLVLLAGLSTISGNTMWINIAKIPAEMHGPVEEIADITEVYRSDVLDMKKGRDMKRAEKRGFSGRDNVWEILRRYLLRKDQFSMDIIPHGVTHYILTYGDQYVSGLSGLAVTVFHTPTFILLVDTATGEDIASFSLKPGVILEPGDAYGIIHAAYVSDHSLRHSSAKGTKYFDYVSITLQNGTLLSEPRYALPLSETSLLGLKSSLSLIPEPLQHPLLTPYLYINSQDNTYYSFTLAPNGVLYAIATSTGKILWRTAISNFIPTPEGASLSVQKLTTNSPLLILNLAGYIRLIDPIHGKELAIFKMPSEIMTTAKGRFYDDESGRAWFGVILSELAPGSMEKVIMLVAGPHTDIVRAQLQDTSFWSRASGLGIWN
ncbi:hypothetical protein GMRT_15230 [Giardia muris]|uniref:ER membrane protein complex subunit 1 n=1 Tax=Giardia muris TaxID=5742 RepID=A0A4Z1SQM0_GIAMU|nr:hypothetical protein GMRT_15230 [Giardia muris]|eukprot:TNJ28154.1 hypothetical protein GMRT_15230 [Giardia muris]